ncbi:MAG: S8 family peptidase [Bacteroidia bacterium]|nr:S8 family peptidase [Bacteroidia bacterium]
MKKTILLILFSVIFCPFIWAQAQFSSATKRFIHDYKKQINVYHKSTVSFSSDFIQEYALYQKSNSYIIGALLWVQPEKIDLTALNKLGLRQLKKAGDIYSIRIPIEHLEKLKNIEGIRLVDIGDTYSQDLQNALISSRADSAHKALGGLNQSYTGKNVVVAIIDWGFDYTHPMFYDSTLNTYRVVRAWDQNKVSGPAPEGFDFGTAYESKEALLAAKEDTLYVFGPGSHGTHVGGIAGGQGAGTKHIGVALNSDLIFISLRRDAPSLIDAYLYVEKYAKSVNKPFVINMSFGSHLGPHDGTSLENVGIDAIVGKGKIAVASAGNNGTNNFHIQYPFKSAQDTLRTLVSFTPASNYWGQALSMWGSSLSSFSVRFRLLNPDNSTALLTPWYHSKEEPVLTDVFSTPNGDTLEARITATASFVTNQKPNIRAELRRRGNLRVLLEAVSSDECELHMWNVVRLTNRFTNWGSNFSKGFPGTVGGNSDYGLGEPGGVGKSVITIGSYRAEIYRSNGNISFGQLSSFSSKGPTVDGRRKPDICGPGQEVISSVNSYDTSPKNPVEQVVFNGRTYEFEAYSGTSMSGPAVAGMVALMLEKNPGLQPYQVKEILQRTSRLDNYTGQISLDSTSLVWGSGKANVLAALRELDNYPYMPLVAFEQYKIYPNPSEGTAMFIAPSDVRLEVIDMNGRKVYEGKFLKNEAPYTLDLHYLKYGLYYFRFSTDTGVNVQKWLKLDLN